MGEIKWSATRIDTANYCRMRYWLRYVKHVPQLKLPVFPKGTIFHNGMEHFHERLGTEEDIKDVTKYKNGNVKKYHYKGNKVKYHDAKSFGMYLKGKWMQTVVKDRRLKEEIDAGKYYGKELERKKKQLIAWKNKNQPYEIQSQITESAELVFDQFVEEGPPEYSELKFNFILRDLYFPDNPKNVFNLHFSGSIDEVRLREIDGKMKVVVRDYKTGNPWIDEMKIKHDPQLTLYNVGLCSLVMKNDEMAERLGLTERRKQYMGNPIYTDPEFIEEFFMIEAPVVGKRMIAKNPQVESDRLPKTMHPKNRTDQHFYELIKMIKSTENEMVNGNICPERGRKCDYCDVKVPCDNALERAISEGPIMDNGQRLFDHCAVMYEKQLIMNEGSPHITMQEEKEFDYEEGTQRSFNFKRKTSY